MKEIRVSFNLADSEYLTALRLVAGSVCACTDADIDAVEDFKVCVTESALILKNCGFERLTAVFAHEEGVVCMLSGEGGAPCEGDNALSLALIGALVSSCDIAENRGIIERVTLKL